MMPSSIYVLCAVASFLCAFLQVRAYRRARSRFLLWTSICFSAIFINNVLLYMDIITGPNISLLMPRTLILLGGLSVLMFGFLWEVG